MSKPTEITIRGFHLDYNGHVNNSRYLEFFEEARWNHFSSFLFSEQFIQQWQIVIARIAVDFHLPVELGDVITIENQLVRIGEKSFSLEQKCFLRGTEQLVTSAEVIHVILNKETQQSEPLQGELERLLFHSILSQDEIAALRST